MPDERRTITLLWAGVAAPLIFTTVYLVEGTMRVGYDPLRHQVSLLTPASVIHVLGAVMFLFGLIVAAAAFAVRSGRNSRPAGRSRRPVRRS